MSSPRHIKSAELECSSVTCTMGSMRYSMNKPIPGIYERPIKIGVALETSDAGADQQIIIKPPYSCS